MIRSSCFLYFPKGGNIMTKVKEFFRNMFKAIKDRIKEIRGGKQ